MPVPVAAAVEVAAVAVVAHPEHRGQQALLALQARHPAQLQAARPVAHQAVQPVVVALAGVAAEPPVELRALRVELRPALPVVHRQRQLLPRHQRRRVHLRPPRTASSSTSGPARRRPPTGSR